METGRREAEEPPTRRTPGASVAAIVEAARRDAARHGAAGADAGSTVGHQAAPQPVNRMPPTDSDGFITVGKGGKPTAAAATRAAAAAAGSSGSGAMDARSAPAGRAEVRNEEEAPVEQQCDDEDLDGEELPQQGPSELRQKWTEEAALVRRLAKQGLPSGHPALAAAHAARDAAEAAWRKAKQPAPLATRLRWAQAKLNRALEMAEATSAAIKKADDEHDKLMVLLHDRRADDGARVRKRQQAVEELQREIGGVGSTARPAGGDASALLEACGGLCNSVGPELAALAERLPDGSEVRQTVNQLMATLAASQRRVEEAAGLHQPQAFDIGDDDADGADADDMDDMSVASQWSEGHEIGRDLEAAPGSQATGGVGTTAPRPGDDWSGWGQAQWQTSQWRTDPHGRWFRSSWADQWEAEHGQAAGWSAGLQSATAQGGARRSGGEHDVESGEPSAKHRRQVMGHTANADGATAATADGEVATRTQATAAAATTAPLPTGPAGAAAFGAQVAEIVEQAIGLGVQPVTEDGSDLITLSPAQLARWASDNLGDKANR